MNHLNVRGVALADLAGAELLVALLGARGHGRPSPSDPGVEQLRKDLTRGRARAPHMIARVLLADVADGVALEHVRHFGRTLDAILVANATESTAAAPRALRELHLLETALDGAMDQAQWRQATEGSADALRVLGRRAEALMVLLTEMLARINLDLYGPQGAAWTPATEGAWAA